MRISCTVNGRPVVAEDVWEGESLLYVLRERMGLPGSKNACEQGECGSCSVYLDGTLVCACLVLGGQAQGRQVVTVEGIGSTDSVDSLHPVQEAFVEAGAGPGGFCTPGLIVSTHHLLQRLPPPTTVQIPEAPAGNICPGTGYAQIIHALHLATGRMTP